MLSAWRPIEKRHRLDRHAGALAGRVQDQDSERAASGRDSAPSLGVRSGRSRAWAAIRDLLRRAAPGSAGNSRRSRCARAGSEIRNAIPPAPRIFCKRLAEKFFHFAAAQADDVRVLLLEPRFVIMLIAAVVHQVELVHQAAAL